jgi:hypothetical protein
MEQLEVLCESIIDTLKQFSTVKCPLTSTTLKKAFSRRREIVSLLYPVCNGATNEQGQKLLAHKELSRVSLREPEASREPSVPISELRNAFLKIMDNLGPIIKDDHENLFCELQKKINTSESPLTLMQKSSRTIRVPGERSAAR